MRVCVCVYAGWVSVSWFVLKYGDTFTCLFVCLQMWGRRLLVCLKIWETSTGLFVCFEMWGDVYLSVCLFKNIGDVYLSVCLF